VLLDGGDAIVACCAGAGILQYEDADPEAEGSGELA
jgi:hypothetical protein